MSTRDFLLEIGCEELPPKLLSSYADNLMTLISDALTQNNIAYEKIQWFAAPRRLAVLAKKMADQQPTQTISRRGPALNLARDAQGHYTKAALGFAQSCGVDVTALGEISDDKGTYLYFEAQQPGRCVKELLPSLIEAAVKNLAIAKPMIWGAHDAQFIRPVRWLLALWGGDIIPLQLLDQTAACYTYGHRVHHPQKIAIANPNDYVELLKNVGHVWVDFKERHDYIEKQAKQAAQNIQGTAIISNNLLDEVTAIVEWPVILTAEFDADFLKVPQEALMSAMQQHQKSFPVVDTNGKLMPYFIFVSNLNSQDPSVVIAGNEKVMRARLSDAKFFYETDLKTPLIDHLEALKKVVFQTGLGSLYDRTKRIARLASDLALAVNAAPVHAYRAGLLSKCDLMTAMVGEFPELQGIMGSYYAQAAGEALSVVKAIGEQYLPAGPWEPLPETQLGVCLALAEKIDTLVGLFGIHQKPTGSKDPFGLRRAAIGITRLIIEKQLSFDLKKVLEQSVQNYENLPNENTVTEVLQYIIDRLENWTDAQKMSPMLFKSIRDFLPTVLQNYDLYDYTLRLIALRDIDPARLETVRALLKRVNSILPFAQTEVDWRFVDIHLLKEPAEQQLHKAISLKKERVQSLLEQHHYEDTLICLLDLAPAIANFFEQVMVNDPDANIRNNRMHLLANVRILLNSVVDLSEI